VSFGWHRHARWACVWRSKLGGTGAISPASGGTCGRAVPSRVVPLIKPFGRKSVLVGGASFVEAATSVAIRYPDGRVEELRLVRVTGLPFSGAFFVAVVRRSDESKRPVRLDVRDSNGRAVPGQTMLLP
jgi:hypothetical protein